jgi:hypothetical protein
MANTNYQNVGYSLTQGPLTTLSALPIVAKRAPTTADKNYQIGQLWIYAANNAPYILTSVVNNLATWLLLESGGGAGVFASLTVTPGPISLTGTTSINTAGAGVTTIGTGGTGAVNIGNATGNTAVTGSLTATSLISTTTITAGTGITSTTGNIVSTAGNVEGIGAVASGDNAGLASTTSLTNVNALVTSGTGAFVVKPITGAGVTASTGFLKFYQGTTAVYVPYWLATS